jgi:hypothetical protein
VIHPVTVLAGTLPVAASGLARPVPTGALYSVLLLLHVAAAVVGFGAVAVTGAQAARARRGPAQAGAASIRRYFRPGVNWAGRVLYAVPVLGFALVADSAGAFEAADSFVVAGLLLWLAGATLAEAVVWPAERRIQAVVTERWDDPAMRGVLERDCVLASAAAVVVAGIFVAGVVVMIGKP